MISKVMGCLSRLLYSSGVSSLLFFFFQAEDGIRYLVRSRGLGDVYKRQVLRLAADAMTRNEPGPDGERGVVICTASVAAYDLSLIHI